MSRHGDTIARARKKLIKVQRSVEGARHSLQSYERLNEELRVQLTQADIDRQKGHVERFERQARKLQRHLWRCDQNLGDDWTNEAIDADLFFHIRFPDALSL